MVSCRNELQWRVLHRLDIQANFGMSEVGHVASKSRASKFSCCDRVSLVRLHFLVSAMESLIIKYHWNQRTH